MCSKPGKTELAKTNFADLPETNMAAKTGSIPGYGATGGPTFYSFWVKDRRSDAPTGLDAFSKLALIQKISYSTHFVFYSNTTATGAITLQADADDLLNTAETAYTALVNTYGAGSTSDVLKNGGRIIIFMYDIQDGYGDADGEGGTKKAYVAGYFAPRDLYLDSFTKALYEDAELVLYHDPGFVAAVRGRSNENQIIQLDSNPFYNGVALGGDAAKGKNLTKETIIHEVAHLFAYNRRVRLGEKYNHLTWIAEGIAEQAPQLTASLTVNQTERMTLHKNPFVQSLLTQFPSLIDSSTWENTSAFANLTGIVQTNFFFNYLRSRAGNNTAATSLFADIVKQAKENYEGVDASIRSLLSSDIGSVYGDWVLTNLLKAKNINQQNGLTLTSFTDTAGNVTNAGAALTALQTKYSYDNANGMSFIYTSSIDNSLPLLYADGNKCLPKASFVYLPYTVPAAATDYTPVNDGMDSSLRIFLINMQGNPNVTVRQYLPSQTIPISTFTAGHNYVFIVYNPTFTGGCKDTGNVRVNVRNLAKWIGGSQSGWQIIPGANPVNVKDGFFRTRGMGASLKNVQGSCSNGTDRTKTTCTGNGGTWTHETLNYLYIADSVQQSVNRWNIDTGAYDFRMGGLDQSCTNDNASDDGWKDTNNKMVNNYCRRAFNTPEDVAVDERGYIYVADSTNHRIVKRDKNGNFIAWLGLNLDDKWQCEAGNTYNSECTNVGAGTNDVLSPQTLVTLGAETDPCMFHFPVGIALDEPNNIMYVVNRGNNRVVKRNLSTGQFLGYIGNGVSGWQTPACNPQFIGSLVTGPERTKFKNPRGIAMDATYIYVADENNHRVSRYLKTTGITGGWLGNATNSWQNTDFSCTATGSIGTGACPASDIQSFRSPADVIVYNNGTDDYLLIADQVNLRLVRRKISDGSQGGSVGGGYTQFSFGINSVEALPGDFPGYQYPAEHMLFPMGMFLVKSSTSGLTHNYAMVTTVYNARVTRWNLDCIEDNTLLNQCSN